MSEDVAVIGYGGKFYVYDTTYKEIKGVGTIAVKPPGAAQTEKIDVTSFSSASMLREVIDGFSELQTGSVTFDMVYDGTNANQALLRAWYLTGAEHGFKVDVPAASGTVSGTFNGRVSGFEVTIAYDDAIRASVEVTIDDAGVTWA